MNRNTQIKLSQYLFYLGYLYYSYIYRPIKSVYVYFRYMKDRNEIKNKYKGKI